MILRKTLVSSLAVFLALFGVCHAAGPENAHQVDATGWWECDRGFIMQPRAGGCVPESEISRERVIMSEVPSAGDGSLRCSAFHERTLGLRPSREFHAV